MRAFLFAVSCWLGLSTALLAQEAPVRWKAGLAKRCITPSKPMWMSGYASRTKPAEGAVHDLWIKALALQDPAGQRVVLVTMDLVGIDRELAAEVATLVEKKHQLPRAALMLSTSHTHCGPVVRSNLNVMYALDAEQQQRVREYGDLLRDRLVQVVSEALSDLQPAQLSWGTGQSDFAVNRRNNKEPDVPQLREQGALQGPVDHQVPVLAIHGDKRKLRALVFGYACHATVLSFYQWCGDYPGFAQLELEKNHPGALALFWAGCGADQNPLPRRTVELAEKYGLQLARSVNAVLQGKMQPIQGKLVRRFDTIDLPFADLPAREQLLRESQSSDRFLAARAKLLLEQLRQQGSLRGSYPYPVQTWQLGQGPTWVALGGEVVVDYVLRLRRELGEQPLWVTAYANDVMAYIPSVRVLKEGGYEGASSMIYYGLPTVWSPRVEDKIVGAVHQQVKQVRGRP